MAHAASASSYRSDRMSPVALALAVLLHVLVVAALFWLIAILSIALVYSVRKWVQNNPIESSDPKLNDRGARLVGEILTVVEKIENGRGRVTDPEHDHRLVHVAHRRQSSIAPYNCSSRSTR